MKAKRTVALALLALLAAVIFPAVNPDPFSIFILILVFTYAVVALYLNLLIGYGGIFFVSPMIFVGIGGYTAAWLSSKGGFEPWGSLGIGAAVAVISSFIFSLLSGRLKGLYMALYSVVFGLLLGSLAVQSIPQIFYWTGGPIGLTDVRDLEIGGIALRSFGGVPYYYFSLGILIVSALVLRKLLRSKFGLAFRSLRDAEVYASAMGVDAYRLKILAFLTAAFFMGLMGGIQAHFFADINPTTWGIDWILNYLTILVYGGLGTFAGPIVGATVFVILSQNLSTYGAWRFVVIGVTVILTLLIIPSGIIGRIEEFRAAKKGRSLTPVPKVLFHKAAGTDK